MSDTSPDIDITQKTKWISRLDQESKHTHGWQVRGRHIGKTYSKLFSDKKHGGNVGALSAAIVWRNELEKQLGLVRTDKKIVTVCYGKVKVVGVCLNNKLKRYEVKWLTREGKQGATSVSLHKYGKKVAFKLACAIRAEKEAERLAE